MILKIKWGEAIKQAEKKKALHQAQFGCRKRKMAHDPIFIETLQNRIKGSQDKKLQISFDAQASYY
jgi:hypothetical protein